MRIAKQQFKLSSSSAPSAGLIHSSDNFTGISRQRVRYREFSEHRWRTSKQLAIISDRKRYSPNRPTAISENSQPIASTVLIWGWCVRHCNEPAIALF
jgi:hypothetical protein